MKHNYPTDEILPIRNAGLNLIAQSVPVVIAVITIPHIIGALGLDRFGILSLMWVILCYCSFLDMGLGRATTKYISELISRGDLAELPKLVNSSIVYQALLGVVGALLFVAMIPLILNRVLYIPPLWAEETRVSFLILAVIIPISVLGLSLRSVLEGVQLFGIINGIRTVSNTFIFASPLTAVFFDISLVGILIFMLIISVVSLLAYLAICLRTFPSLKNKIVLDHNLMRPLITFGGWTTVWNMVAPFLVYGERIVISSIIGMAALAYYSVPSDVVIRFWIIPSSLSSALFPAFSSLMAMNKEHIGSLYARSLKYLLLIMAPMMLAFIVLANPIMTLWLGKEFAEETTVVLQILAVGVFFYSLATIPLNYINAVGRPDLVGKLVLAEFPFYAGTCWFLIEKMGITGAALGWSLRLVLECIVLFVISWNLCPTLPRSLTQNGLIRAVAVTTSMTIACFLVLQIRRGDFLVQSIASIGLILVFPLAAWHFLLDLKDKELLSSLARR